MTKLKNVKVEKPIEYIRKQSIEKLWSWNSNGDLTGLNEQIKEVKEKFKSFKDVKFDSKLSSGGDRGDSYIGCELTISYLERNPKFEAQTVEYEEYLAQVQHIHDLQNKEVDRKQLLQDEIAKAEKHLASLRKRLLKFDLQEQINNIEIDN